MADVRPSRSTDFLLHAVAATALVTLAPAAAVWSLASTGTVTGLAPLVVVGVLASMAIAYAGNALWQTRPGSKDVLFSDLMLWGWARRWRLERRLGDAVTLLGLDSKAVRKRTTDLDPEDRIKVLKTLAGALEALDPYTHGHSRRVARYSTMIAKKLDLPTAEIDKIRTAAAVHDVGKLEVPLDVLNKPGRLTEAEFEVIKRHSTVGARMVSALDDDDLTQIVAHHHERLDGSGYPARIGGSEIPLGARIVAVADTFDALTSTRAYRPAKRHRDALRILHQEAGTQLDPDVVHAFARCYSGFTGVAAWSVTSGLPQTALFPFGASSASGATVATKALTVLAATAATGSIATSPALSDPRDTSTSGFHAHAGVGQHAGGTAWSEGGSRSLFVRDGEGRINEAISRAIENGNADRPQTPADPGSGVPGTPPAEAGGGTVDGGQGNASEHGVPAHAGSAGGNANPGSAAGRGQSSSSGSSGTRGQGQGKPSSPGRSGSQGQGQGQGSSGSQGQGNQPQGNSGNEGDQGQGNQGQGNQGQGSSGNAPADLGHGNQGQGNSGEGNADQGNSGNTPANQGQGNSGSD